MALARSLPNTPKIRSLPLSSPSQTNNRSFVEVFRAAPPARFRFGPRTTPRGRRDARRLATHCDPRVPTRVRLDRTSREGRSGARAADRARRAPSASSSAVGGWIARRRGRLARRRAGGGENLGRGSRRPPARSRDGAMAANEPLGKLEWNFSQVFGERTPGEEVQDGAFESRGAARSARWRVFSFSLAIADARRPPPAFAARSGPISTRRLRRERRRGPRRRPGGRQGPLGELRANEQGHSRRRREVLSEQPSGPGRRL